MGRKFEDSGGADLPVGSHEPCQLLSITRHEPSAENLAKYPDMGPSLCFRFMLHKPSDPETHGATAVVFCSDSASKLSKLYGLCTDLRDGLPPEEYDPDDYTGKWYRVTVRQKPNSEKLTVTTASPLDPPDGIADGWSETEAVEKARKKAAKKLKKQRKAAKAETKEAIAAAATSASDDDDDADDEIPF